MLQGLAVAGGAPLGWLLIQFIRGVPPAVELARNPALYSYMIIGTVLVFALFGRMLGEREDRLVKANRALEELAVTDPLTGMRNARYFRARLAEEQAERDRTGRPLALAIIDLDHFKRVNDTYGHPVGDEVLGNVAAAIASVTRHGETAARIGGEEFALLLPGSTGAAAREAADRVRSAIGAMHTRVSHNDGGAIRITGSAGVASTSELPDADIHALYTAADDALYRAKAEGRNRTVVAGA